MTRKVVLGLALLVTCSSISATVLADPPGKAKGHHKEEWKEHGKGSPGWARGGAYWEGRASPQYWGDQGYWSYGYGVAPPPAPPQPYYYGNSGSYTVPYAEPAPYPYYAPAPYPQGWNFEGSIHVYPQPGW